MLYNEFGSKRYHSTMRGMESFMVRGGIKGSVSMALAAMLLLAACSGGGGGGSSAPSPAPGGAGSGGSGQSTPAPSASPSSAPEEKEPVTLQMVWWAPQTPEWQRMLDAFHEEYPWITVEPIQITNGVTDGIGQQVMESIAAGNPIDIFWNNSMDYVYESELYEDLTPWIENDPEFKSYPFKKGYLETFQIDGRQIGIPHSSDAFMVFINKDLLKLYGLEMPSLDWTWDDYRALAKAATNPDAGHYGISQEPNTEFFRWTYALLTVPYANGHAPNMGYMNEDWTRNLADGSVPEILDDLNLMHEILTKDGSMLNAARAEAAGLAGVDTWASGQSLLHLFITPGIPGFRNSLNFEWDILPMPAGKVRQANFVWINPWFMSRASDNKEEAWLFMKWWETNKEAQKLHMEIAGAFPNTDDPEMVEYFENLSIYDGLNKEALKRAMDTAAYDPTQTMIGGRDFANAYNGYYPKGAFEEVSAHDYFPAAMQDFNNKLKERLEKLKK